MKTSLLYSAVGVAKVEICSPRGPLLVSCLGLLVLDFSVSAATGLGFRNNPD